jgi:hypothetical protein
MYNLGVVIPSLAATTKTKLLNSDSADRGVYEPTLVIASSLARISSIDRNVVFLAFHIAE